MTHLQVGSFRADRESFRLPIPQFNSPEKL